MVHEQEGLIMYSRKIHDLVHELMMNDSCTFYSRKIHDLVHELMMNDSCTLTDYVVHELFIRHS